MMQRILNSKNFVAFILAAATGMTLYFRVPFPESNIFLRVMALRCLRDGGGVSRRAHNRETRAFGGATLGGDVVHDGKARSRPPERRRT